MSAIAEALDHLHNAYTEPIRDPLWHNIDLSPELMRIVRERAFQKLGGIKQLGPAYQVYPGATHTRLSHSLGVFHLARRVMIALLRSDPSVDLSVEGVKAFLCAALLHDLGHFPFAHSLKELPLKEHERLAAEQIVDSPLSETIRSALGVDPGLVAGIVDTQLPLAGAEVSFFRGILSGVLDPDKLDYLNRDAYFCGVPYGVQDTDFVISRMRPHRTWGIAVDAQGATAVENVLFSKYLMYRTVYWHKTVRVATAMIKKAVYLDLREGLVKPESLYGLDDVEFFARFSALKGPGGELIRRVSERNLLKTASEETFAPGDGIHGGLLDLDMRAERERLIALRLSRELGVRVPPESVIIDIPEPISFEVLVPIVASAGEERFSDSDSVFRDPVVEGFGRTLRKVRLMLPADVAPKVRNPDELIRTR